MENAGQKLWLTQLQQGTGLCVGLDPHFNTDPAFSEALYLRYANKNFTDWYGKFFNLMKIFPGYRGKFSDSILGPSFLSGVTNYCLLVVEMAWRAGIRVFKPQSAFYEQFGLLAFIILARVRQHIAELSQRDYCPAFVIDDCKRGDIDTTQSAYYRAILTGLDEEMLPGIYGQLGFDAMTVTAWMGQDVLTPALPYLKTGKGVIVVTRTSNPSGTTLQDALAHPNDHVPLSGNQEPFRLTAKNWEATRDILGRCPTACEIMLYQTEQFCQDNGLAAEGVSPVMSVIGATVKMDGSFRKLRPTGIALIPAFGFQGGGFDNIIPLAVTEGPLAGHLGILNSARGIMFAWLKKAGGGGDPAPGKLAGEIARAIDQFRKDEKAAYTAAGLGYPF